MIAGGNATLLVSDVGRAVRFYVETLGFKLVGVATPHWAKVDAGDGLVIGLHQRPTSGKTSDGSTSGVSGGSEITLGLDVNQPIAEVVEVLANRGVQFHGPVKEEGGVKLAFFADLDGNTLYLVEAT
jgi:catechol 2,3-dioxygenase-like lactoylglutathione lyase family enzyme